MFTRRTFATCSICTAIGLTATGVDAQSQPSTSGGIRRTILSREDAPDSKYETVQMIVEVDAGVEVPRHTHPGTESSTLLSGEAELYIKGQANKTMTPGNMYLIPASVPHGVRNVTAPLRIAITYVVEKGKPILSPAPEQV